MQTALITGVNGFAGRHLARLLKSKNYKVFGTTRASDIIMPTNMIDGLVVTHLDNKDNWVRVINEVKPDVIFHLASQSNVKVAWEQPSLAFLSNTMTALYLFEAVKHVSKNIRIVSIGSSEEYGFYNEMEFPIKEESYPHPSNPYGVSKHSVALLARQFYEAFDMDIIHVRPFNHIGPGQKRGFVVPDFAYQVAMIEKGIQKPVISVGNLSSKRDFTDVRDIVKGYELIASKGLKGQTYNICSGKPVVISDLLEILISLSSKQITIEVDPGKLRPIDIPIYYGSNKKIIEHTSWARSIELTQSLEDVLEEIRKEAWSENL
ncbi:GDP-mannose 4,6-dehydratase [Paenibacillus sp. p3-SID1389]|uniref:GDP-mannose 4,6-dehydratase n=1 Tax=Paenibacillus sp. p3-SID1389 TaxID=2916364 RepID=UPI0021A84DD7|nr:GDP-mannose 4,6-dehydratase [Paenibacillus sp. p3-SID1389]MCT2195575.1 GDP-mannose 4,6-dehydratase [Paenibacillus sp. p3-SID1389]